MNQCTVMLKNVKKVYEGRTLFEIDELSAYIGDKIAIIGNNGAGKSTLLKIINNDITPDSGNVMIDKSFNYLAQIAEPRVIDETIDFELLSRFNVPNNNQLSGGEQTKLRIIEAISTYKMGLLLDEPTTHLDKDSIDLVIEQLEYYYGTLIFVSHDRHFINKIANKIWEVKEGKVNVFNGNYDEFLEKKELEKKTLEAKSETIQKERARLTNAATKQQAYANKLGDYNKSQAKSHNVGRLAQSKQKDTVQKNAHKKAKAIESRLEQLEEIDVPEASRIIKFPMKQSEMLHNKFPIIAQDLSIKRGDKLLLENVSFQLPFGKTIAITGPNGTGKSSLLYEILNNDDIEKSPKLNIITYKQMDYKIGSTESILSYIMDASGQEEPLVRSVLDRLNFNQTELNKSVSDISGGEATRLTLALLFLKRSNVIILDEPTNFIDITTINALEDFIKGYQGIVILVSHDRAFVDNVADIIYTIENKKLKLVKS